MYYFFRLMEKIFKFIRINMYLCYCKIKYGKKMKVGKNVHFGRRFRINMTKNGKLVIGEGTFFNNDCSINVHESVEIGKYNCFGENVKIYDHNHVFNDKSVDMLHNFTTHAIIVGNNNWICSNCVILSKTKIGNNNVIGAGNVINYDLGNDYLVKSITDKGVAEKIYYK